MPSALIIYQYFYPDDVISSSQLTELAEGLVSRGWQVTALPCNRSCRNERLRYSRREIYAGIDIRRIWRPSFPQSKVWGRIANCAWMLGAWSLKAFNCKSDIIIVGTDPAFSALIALAWRLLRKKIKIIHWCLDLYPEAAVAGGLLNQSKALTLLRSLMRAAYKRMDLIVDLGDCMRDRLLLYRSPAKHSTLVPWALTEPTAPLKIDLEERQALFGNSKLALLYSGSFGRAHSCAELLSIARQMRDVDARFIFSVRGNRTTELLNSVDAGDHNISFVPFAPRDRLEARLSATDIHVVSLRDEWTGTVVPSKFFGALAAGRPVLFIGSEKSYVARVIREHSVGWVCSPGSERYIAQELRTMAEKTAPMGELQERCHRVYYKYFARDLILNKFDDELRSLLGHPLFREKGKGAEALVS